MRRNGNTQGRDREEEETKAVLRTRLGAYLVRTDNASVGLCALSTCHPSRYQAAQCDDQ